MKRKTWFRALALGACLTCASTARADYATAVLADEPLGYWRFNDPTLNTAVNAGTAGSDWNGAYVGGQLVSAESFTLVDGRTVSLGAGNTAFEVGNDLDEYMSVEVPLLSDLAQFTMSGWVAPGPRTGDRIGLFGQNDAVEFGFIAPGQIQLWTPAGQVLNYTVDPDLIADETWFHLATVANGNRIRLFVNGEPLERGPSYGNSDFPFNIGGGGIYDTAGNQLTGSVDEVALWTTALSETQIQAHVAAGKAAGGNYRTTVLGDAPTGYWGLDDASGSTATNLGSAGASLNGTYVGGQLAVPGANETYPGFPGGNQAFAGEAPDDGYVSVPGSPLSGAGEFTMSGWVKPGFIVDNRVGLFGQNDAIEFGFINPTTLQLWTPNGGFVDLPLTGEVNEDEWVHIAAVGTGDELQIYIDGELIGVGGGSLEGQPVASYGSSDFFFNVGGGGIYDGTGNQFTGVLDEIAVWDTALSDAQILAHFQAALGGGVLGDFNANGNLDAGDLDLLADAMATNDLAFDLNGDNVTNVADRRLWIEDLKNSYMGDSNLDGEFNSSDLVNVFTAGKFETGSPATWSEGDWTGDKVFNSSDFVEAFQGGGYEIGPRGAVAAVPEPGTLGSLCLGFLGFLRMWRRRSR
jgi:hypothetical protein